MSPSARVEVSIGRYSIVIRYTIDELTSNREHGEALEKNHDQYPAVSEADLTGEDIEDILNLHANPTLSVITALIRLPPLLGQHYSALMLSIAVITSVSRATHRVSYRSINSRISVHAASRPWTRPRASVWACCVVGFQLIVTRHRSGWSGL